MSRTERAGLCDTALEVGPDDPTLCGEWSVKELVAHLVVRESSPAAIGITFAPLAKVNDQAIRRLAKGDFAGLVERLRKGPPLYSPMRPAKADELFNTLEFFVHHEDIRRAQPSWAARSLSPEEENVLWRMVRRAGKGLVRNAGVGVVLDRGDTGAREVLKRSGRSVVVRGLPSELTLFAFGRVAQALVEYDGEPDDVAGLKGASLGI
jgi:uncharacterized protein (TIGR03085 family)